MRHEYTARSGAAASSAAWVPGLTIVSRRRWRSRAARAREGLRATWATFAMVAVQVWPILIVASSPRGTPPCPRHRCCCRYVISLPDSSTSGRAYRCLSQGRN